MIITHNHYSTNNISWEELNGVVRRVENSANQGEQINLVNICPTLNQIYLTAVGDFDRKLKLITWQVS
jgi:hypothetical protein